MDKKGDLMTVFLVILIIIALAAAGILGYKLFNGGYEEMYRQRIASGEIQNPALDKSVEEAVREFDENYIYYMLVSIKAYRLHNPPLSSDMPKIEIYAGDDIYNAEIDSGEILVNRGRLGEKDAIIKTTKEELVKMMKDESYASKSFVDGKSSIELVASKTILFSKGYLKLYGELTGKGVTGSVIAIIFD